MADISGGQSRDGRSNVSRLNLAGDSAAPAATRSGLSTSQSRVRVRVPTRSPNSAESRMNRAESEPDSEFPSRQPGPESGPAGARRRPTGRPLRQSDRHGHSDGPARRRGPGQRRDLQCTGSSRSRPYRDLRRAAVGENDSKSESDSESDCHGVSRSVTTGTRSRSSGTLRYMISCIMMIS
jgi:hypothetical protein